MAHFRHPPFFVPFRQFHYKFSPAHTHFFLLSLSISIFTSIPPPVPSGVKNEADCSPRGREGGRKWMDRAVGRVKATCKCSSLFRPPSILNIFHVNSLPIRRQHRRRRRLSPIHLFPLQYSLPSSPIPLAVSSHSTPSFAPQNVFASPRRRSSLSPLRRCCFAPHGVRPSPFSSPSALSAFVSHSAFLPSPHCFVCVCFCWFVFIYAFLLPSSPQSPTFQPTGSAPTHSIPSHFHPTIQLQSSFPPSIFFNFPIPIPPSNFPPSPTSSPIPQSN